MASNIRIIHKHATQAVWESKSNFIPYVGEIIVFDPDDSGHNYSRVKIGDGVTTLDQLPFLRSDSAVTADKLSASRIIRMDGFITAEAAFDGSKNIHLTTALTQPLSATFSGISASHTHRFDGSESQGEAEYTPEGYVDYEFKPSGSVSAPDITLSATTATITVITGRQNASFFEPAQYTPAKLTTRTEDELLIIDFTESQYIPATYTEGELTSETLTYIQSVSATASAPVFEGNTATGTATLVGKTSTIITKLTPQGTIAETEVVPAGTITINTIEKENN